MTAAPDSAKCHAETLIEEEKKPKLSAVATDKLYLLMQVAKTEAKATKEKK